FFYTEALAGNSQGLLSFKYFRISLYRPLHILRTSPTGVALEPSLCLLKLIPSLLLFEKALAHWLQFNTLKD
ncbi:hypothetical protein, partial [Sphingobacterium multivorum]